MHAARRGADLNAHPLVRDEPPAAEVLLALLLRHLLDERLHEGQGAVACRGDSGSKSILIVIS